MGVRGSTELVKSCRDTLWAVYALSLLMPSAVFVQAQGWAHCWMLCFLSFFFPSAYFSLKENCLSRLFMTCLRQLTWQPLEWFRVFQTGKKPQRLVALSQSWALRKEFTPRPCSAPFIFLETATLKAAQKG